MTEYRTVPVEPTEEMLCAGMDAATGESWWEDAEKIYKAMLAAAPAFDLEAKVRELEADGKRLDWIMGEFANWWPTRESIDKEMQKLKDKDHD